MSNDVTANLKARTSQLGQELRELSERSAKLTSECTATRDKQALADRISQLMPRAKAIVRHPGVARRLAEHLADVVHGGRDDGNQRVDSALRLYKDMLHPEQLECTERDPLHEQALRLSESERIPVHEALTRLIGAQQRRPR